MVDLYSIRRKSSDGANMLATTTQPAETLPNLCSTSAIVNNAEYSIARRLASNLADEVLACLLDNVNTTRTSGNRRSHSENPAETNLHRQRRGYYNDQRPIEKSAIGVKVEVVVPVATLTSRFGARPTHNVGILR